MIGKFNVATLAKQDKILLGFPWLAASKPVIDWEQKTVSLPSTKRSRAIEKKIDQERKKRSLHPLFHRKASVQKETSRVWTNSKLRKPVQVKVATNETTLPYTASIEEVVDEETPNYDTKEDVWSDNFQPVVNDPLAYKLADDEVLVEYAVDGSTV